MGKYFNEINMKDITEAFFGIFFILSIFIIIINSINMTNKGISAEDWNRHSVWIINYMNGNFSQFLIYPYPLFHFFMMIPIIFFMSSIKYFQIIFSILSTATILYVIYRLYGKRNMQFVSLFLAFSMNYLIYSSILTPQPLDYIIFPLTILSFFSDKYKYASLGLLLLIYNHGTGIFFFATFFLYSLFFNRKYLKYLMIVFILSMPVIFVTLYNFISKSIASITMSSWDLQFVNPLSNFFIFSCFLNWCFLPIVIYILYKRRFYMDRKQIFYLLCILCFLPLSILNLWRWVGYFIIPFMFFEISVLTEDLKEIEKNKYKQRFKKVFY